MRKYTRGRTGFAKKVKDVILKTAETKFRSIRLQDTNMSEGAGIPLRYIMRHNRIEYFHIFNNTNPDATKHPIPIQGDSDGQRNGDEIYATGVRIAGSIQMGSIDKHSTYRVFLCEYNDQVYGAGAAIDTYNQTFHEVTGGTNMDTFQHDRIKPKYLRTLKVSSADVADASEGAINFKFWLPLKRKFTFRQDDSPALAMGIKNKYTLMILPYKNISTIAGAAVGDVQVHATLYYKDP